MSTVGACWLGYLFAGWGQNLYTFGYLSRIVQPFDFSFYPVYAYGRNPRKKYAT
jgi:hypothetical protein